MDTYYCNFLKYMFYNISLCEYNIFFLVRLTGFATEGRKGTGLRHHVTRNDEGDHWRQLCWRRIREGGKERRWSLGNKTSIPAVGS